MNTDKSPANSGNNVQTSGFKEKNEKSAILWHFIESSTNFNLKVPQVMLLLDSKRKVFRKEESPGLLHASISAGFVEFSTTKKWQFFGMNLEAGVEGN